MILDFLGFLCFLLLQEIRSFLLPCLHNVSIHFFMRTFRIWRLITLSNCSALFLDDIFDTACIQFKRITRQCVYIDVSNVLRTTWTRWFSSDARIDLADLEHLGLQTSRKVINLLWSTLIFNILKATSLSCRVVDLKVLNIHVVNVIPSMDIIYRVARQLENSRIKKFHYTVTNRKQWKVAGRRNCE